MPIGKAVAIFMDIENKQYTEDEKGTAIYNVCKMPTHNGISKDFMLKVIWWLLRRLFDLSEEDEYAGA